MLTKNKLIFYSSILLNFILIIFFLVGLIPKIKNTSLINSSQINSQQPENKTYSQLQISKPKMYYGKINQLKMLDLSSQPQNGIIFLGDSLTEQGEWSELFNNSLIKNRGIGGDTTQDILARFSSIAESKPQKIFLMIGVNDLWLLKSSKDDILKNYSAILTYLQMKTPDTKIYIQSMLPVNNIDFANFKVDNKDIVFLNEQLKQMAKSFNYKYIDLHSHFVNQAGELSAGYTDDGVHLNGRGYSQWRDLIKNYVNN